MNQSGNSRKCFSEICLVMGDIFLFLLMRPERCRKIRGGREFVKRFVGSEELIQGKLRYCIWIEDERVEDARSNVVIAKHLALVVVNRKKSQAKSTRDFASRPHRFVQIAGRAKETSIVVPRVSSENREYLPVGYMASGMIVSSEAFALYDAPLWNMALIASRLHLGMDRHGLCSDC